MQSIRFYLRKRKNKAGQRPLHAVFFYNGERLEQSTKIMLRDIEWNSKSQSITKECNLQQQMMQMLDHIKSKMIEFYLFGDNKLLDRDNFLKELRSYVFPGGTDDTIESSVREYLDQFLEGHKTKSAPDTYEKYYYFFNNVLWTFIEQNYKEFTFADFDLFFYDQFLIYLIEERDNNNNSCSKAMDRLRTFLNWAAKRGYNKYATYLMYNREDTKIKTYEPSNISLTVDELELLINSKLPNEALDLVRRIFIFMCFTGQRKRDYTSLEWHHINYGVWNLRQHKEYSTTISLELHPICIKILDDLKSYKKPLPIDSHFNIKIKEVFRELGVTGLFSKVNRYGGRAIEEAKPRCDLITMHTSRRTLITISGQLGIRPSVGSKVTGHRDLKVYKQYDKQEIADAIHEFNQTWTQNFNASQLA